ncbi:GNAT family N-acetyltransferase [Bermanella sp. R86510]|uniref:GNAT family N-acetyltransferase n=1 Tax=unclassified Bermanella TaxID=2627862 RepID=UPI0037C89576
MALNSTESTSTSSGHRSIVFLCGDKNWAYEYLSATYGDFKQIAVVSHDKPGMLPTPLQDGLYARIEKPNTMLGFTCRHAIADCHHGFYPDAISAISGTIQAGGKLIVLCPALDAWPHQKDEFAAKRTSYGFDGTPSSPHTIKRFMDAATDAVFIEQWRNPHPKPALLDDTHNTTNENLPPWTPELDHTISIGRDQHHVTAEQKACYLNLSKLITGNDPYYAILQADRGRGKSHLLGLITRVLEEEPNIDNGIKYWVTAPNKGSIKSLVDASGMTLNQFPFIAPEHIQQTVSDHDILIVDEAASLPLPLLMSWAQRIKTIIFATTTHGYEGTGKGFQIRFQQFLRSQTHSNHIHSLYLKQPIRYARNDPLESIIFNAFCLHNEPKGLAIEKIDPDQLRFKHLTQTEMAEQPALLEEVFSLLVQAHYQTRPSDLRDILDAPQFSTFALFSDSTIVAVCLMAAEGGLTDKDTKLIQAIHHGERRPKGHLVPQVLTLHMNQKQALKQNGARIVRIATLPHLRHQNLGSALLTQVETHCRQRQMDYLASSYANTQDVTHFWIKNGFKLVRLGNKFDQASGTRSGMVIKGLSQDGKALQHDAEAFRQAQNHNHKRHQDLTRDEKELIETFVAYTGSFEAIKDILSRCEDWQAEYGTRPFPKKASAEFRELVRRWMAY